MFRFSQKPRYVSESLHYVMLKIETRPKLTEYNTKFVYSTVFTDQYFKIHQKKTYNNVFEQAQSIALLIKRNRRKLRDRIARKYLSSKLSKFSIIVARQLLFGLPICLRGFVNMEGKRKHIVGLVVHYIRLPVFRKTPLHVGGHVL